MKDWQDYVGFQFETFGAKIDQTVSDKIYAWVLVINPPGICISMEKILVTPEQMLYNYVDVGDAVEAVMKEFPEVYIHDRIGLERAQLDVARRSRRGVAKTNFGSTWYYKGITRDPETNELSNVARVDTPIIVVEKDNKYAVIKHPMFDILGFNVKCDE